MDILPDDIAKKVYWSDFVMQIKDRALRPGDQIFLIEAIFEEDFQEEMKEFIIEFRKVLSEIQVEVDFTDIYEDKKYKRFRKLDWFART